MEGRCGRWLNAPSLGRSGEDEGWMTSGQCPRSNNVVGALLQVQKLSPIFWPLYTSEQFCENVFFSVKVARFFFLLTLPEGTDPSKC